MMMMEMKATGGKRKRKEMSEEEPEKSTNDIKKAAKEHVKKQKLEDVKRYKVLMEKNEELEKVITEKNEELKKKKKVIKEKDEELERVIEELKVMKKRKREVKKVIKEKDEELGRVIKKQKKEVKKVTKEMNAKLEEERSELEDLEHMNSTLFVRDRQYNNEIQDARKELIRVFTDLLSSREGSKIGIKRMGEIDEEPFMKVCKKRFVDDDIQLQLAMVCSTWQEILKDPLWHPFKRVGTDKNMKEVVDEDDEKLRSLKQEWGRKAKNAVKTALEELNEYNPSGRYTEPVLWNFEQARIATLKEGIAHLMKEIETLKYQWR